MAILKQIEKYIDYYNQYISQSLNLAEKTSELLRRKKINQLAAESIDAFKGAKTQTDILEVTQQLSKQALQENVPEAIQTVYAGANLQTKIMEDESQKRVTQQLYSNLNLDELRIVGGELKTVKDIIDTLDPNLSIEEKYKIVSTLPQGKVEHGLSTDGNKIIESIIDNTGKILKTTQTGITKKDGNLYIEGTNEPVDFKTQYEIYLRNKAEEEQQLRLKQLSLDERRIRDSITYSTLQRKMELNKGNYLSMNSIIGNYLYNTRLEKEDRSEEDLTQEERTQLIKLIDDEVKNNYQPYAIQYNKKLLDDIERRYPGFKNLVREYIDTDQYIQERSKLLDYELTNDSDKKTFAKEYDSIINKLVIEYDDEETKKILNSQDYSYSEKIDLIYRRYKVLKSKGRNK